MREKRKMDLINGPFKKKLLLIAIPLVLTGFLQLFYNSADLIIVGRFSSDGKLAQAAISSTNSIVWLMLNLFMGFSVGINVVCARKIGAKDDKGIQRVIHTAILLGLLSGVIVAIMGFSLSRTMLELMNSTESVIDLSTLYLKIYFIGMPFNFVYEFAASILRAKGETKKPLYFLLIAGAINVGLNLVFVLVFKMSVAGVAIATVISQFISMVLVLITLIKATDSTKLYFSKLRIHFTELKSIVLIGLPAGIQGSMFSISNVLIQSSVNSFGDVFMAGSGNAGSIEGYLNILVDSICKAVITFVGQNFGAKKKDNISKVMKDGFLFMTIVILVASSLVFLFRYPLLGLFNPSKDVIEAGMTRIIYNCLPYIVYGYMQLMVSLLRGLGKSILPMIISICGICVFRVVWILAILPFNHTPEMLFISYPLSWVLTLAMQCICYMIFRKKLYAPIMRNSEMQEQCV